MSPDAVVGRLGERDEEEVAAAVHGSFCPKMCSFACPVTAATGRDDAVPWSFHRTLTDLANGRLGAGSVAARRLSACAGCLGCQVPCEFDQDVPAQVRAGRRLLVAEGHAVAGGDEARAAVIQGRSPYGISAPSSEEVAATGGTVLLVGCRDDDEVVAAALRILGAGGIDAAVHVPDGCCGAALDDLGFADEAERLGTDLAAHLDDYQRVLLLDPHCAPSLSGADGPDVLHLVEYLESLLDAGQLPLRATERTVTYHDPCLLARGAGITSAPRRLLEATGAEVAEPEHSGVKTFCSGAGLAMQLVDPDAAEATAAARREQLAAVADLVVTACSGAGRHLAGSDGAMVHLLRELADHLEEQA